MAPKLLTRTVSSLAALSLSLLALAGSGIPAYADTAANIVPTSNAGAQPGGSVELSSPQLAYNRDGQSATASLRVNQDTKRIYAGFDFSAIPAGAIINSVTVNSRYGYDSGNGGRDLWFGALVNGSAVSTQADPSPAGAGWKDYSWTPGGHTFTRAELDSFGVEVGSRYASEAPGIPVLTFYLDALNVTVDWSAAPADRAPVLDPIADVSVAEGATVTIPVSGSDPDGDAVALGAGNVPAFATYTDIGPGTGQITVNPGFGTAGSYKVTAFAANGGGNDSQEFTITVTHTDRGPVLNPIADVTVAEGATVTIPVSGTDPDGDTVALGAANLPPFATYTDLGPGSGQISVSPGYAAAGSYKVTAFAANGGGNDSQQFTITVTDVNRDPVLSPIGDQTVAEGATLDVPVSATDPDGDKVALSVGTLPSYATFTDNGDGTGVLHLAPGFNDSGTTGILVVATDASNLQDYETVKISVTNVNRAPVVDEIPNQALFAGDVLEVSVSASDLDGDTLALQATNLPAWATLVDNGDGTGIIRLAPPAASVGNVEASVSVSDGSLTGNRAFRINVLDATAPTITVPADITTTAATPDGTKVNYTAAAVDKTDGNLTPNCIPASGSVFPIGTTTVQCEVTDTDGNQVAASFTVTVTTSTGPNQPGTGESPGTGTGTGTDNAGTGTSTANGSDNQATVTPAGNQQSPLAETGANQPAAWALIAALLTGLGALLVIKTRRRA